MHRALICDADEETGFEVFVFHNKDTPLTEAADEVLFCERNRNGFVIIDGSIEYGFTSFAEALTWVHLNFGVSAIVYVENE